MPYSIDWCLVYASKLRKNIFSYLYFDSSVIESNHAPMAQEFLKKGCPRSLRGQIWAQVLGSTIKPMVHVFILM